MTLKDKEIMKKALLPDSYVHVLESLKERIRQSQLKAALSANRHLIELYWHIGKTIVERQQMEKWGKSVVERLAHDLKNEFPDMSGFSPRNIWRMRAFYLTYAEELKKVPQLAAEFGAKNLPQPVAEIPFNFYLSALDDLVKTAEDNPSIGIILCATKDRILAEYALRDVKKPIGVAEWKTKITRALPKKLKGSLPTIEEIEAELGREGR